MGAVARIEVATLLATLDALPAMPSKVAYALARGRVRLKAIAREVEAHRNDAYNEDVLAYLREREELGAEHIAKDDKGQPIPEGNGWKLKDPAAYRAALLELEGKSSEVIDKLKAQDAALADWMLEEEAVEAWGIPSGLELPDLTVAQAEVMVLLTVEA